MKKKSELNRRELLRAAATGSTALAAGGLSLTALSGNPWSVSQAESSWNDLQKGMHIVITGSGSALPDPERGNASQAVVIDGSILQFDCGRRAMDNLMQAGVNPVDVDYIFFTHLHFDHIATYDYFVISSWIAGRQTPFKVFGPAGTVAMSRGAFEGMHAMDVRFVKQIVDSWPQEMDDRPASDLPVDVQDLEAGVVLETDKFKVTAAETPHFDPTWGAKSLGYRVDSEYGSVAISGDTAPSQSMVDLSKGADVLIHECVIPDYGMSSGGKFSLKSFHETDPDKPKTGHTAPSELGKLAQKAKVKMLIATHLPPYTSVPAAREMSSMYYGPGEGPEIWDKFKAALEKHYQGEVVLAQDAQVLQVGS